MSPTASDRVQAAQQALAASRQQLRQALLPGLPDTGPQASARPWAWRRFWRRTAGWPLPGLARDALRAWWRQQSWHATGSALVLQARDGMLPLLRRHPLQAVAIAGALGAGLVALRPWQWPWLRRQARQLPGQLSLWAWAQFNTPQVQTALAGLLAWAAQGSGGGGGAAPRQAPPADRPTGPTGPTGPNGPNGPARPEAQTEPDPSC